MDGREGTEDDGVDVVQSRSVAGQEGLPQRRAVAPLVPPQLLKVGDPGIGDPDALCPGCGVEHGSLRVDDGPRVAVLLDPDDDKRVALLGPAGPVTWRTAAKDGAEIPPSHVRSGPAQLRINVGETYDFLWTPEPGEFTLQVVTTFDQGAPAFPRPAHTCQPRLLIARHRLATRPYHRLVCASHFPSPSFGRFVREGEAFWFRYEREVAEIVIERPRAEVAAYASDPDNATSWYRNIKAIEWRSPKPVAVGSRVGFEAEFLGRRIVRAARLYAAARGLSESPLRFDVVGIDWADDGRPRISINDVWARDGDGTTLYTFTVSLSAPLGEAVTVNYATADGGYTAACELLDRTGADRPTALRPVRHITWCASHGLTKFKRLIAPMNLHVEELSHERCPSWISSRVKVARYQRGLLLPPKAGPLRAINVAVVIDWRRGDK